MAHQLLPPPREKSDENEQESLVSGPDKEASDGLLVAARGLSLQRTVLGQFVKAHATPANLVLLLNCSTSETEYLFNDVQATPTVPPLVLCAIANETPAPTRKLRYLGGGVISCTSRILVVDMLNGVVPLHLVTGVLMCHAHRITETSTEAFILRLLRETNKVAFIRAFSEAPESLTNTGVLWKLEKTMKLLFLRKVFFWPRFHIEVQDTIDAVPPISVHQIRVPMTKNMSDIQAAIIDCINESILEVKRVHRFLDPDELSVENALFASFEQLLKMQLDPVWHRVSIRTKQVVSDISTLRRLLGYLTTYDCVAFYSFLESIQAANALDPLQSTRTDSSVSPWLFYDATDVVFSTAKKRVFKKATDTAASTIATKNSIKFGTSSTNLYIPEGIEIVGEEQPKWSAICDLVRDINLKRKVAESNGEELGPILIMVHGERTCSQLSEVLSNHIFPTSNSNTSTTSTTKKRPRQGTSDSEDEQTLQPKPPQQQSRRRQRGGGATSKTTVPPRPDPSSSSNNPRPTEFSTLGIKTLMARQVSNYFKWKGIVSNIEQNLRNRFNNRGRGRGGLNNRGGAVGRERRGGGDVGRGGSTAHLRRRARGGGSGTATNRANVIETITENISVADGHSDLIEDDEITREISDSRPLESLGKRYLDPSAPLDVAEFHSYFGQVDLSPSIVIRPYSTSILSPTGGYMTNGDDDSRILETLKPSTVVMYDVDTAFIRRLEVYHAQNKGTPDLFVYFMLYDNSIEEQKYLTSLRKEKDSFEKLIREKANMAIPIDQDGRVVDPEDLFWRNLDTRVAGGQALTPAADANQIIVDVREFRSALPSLLHSRRMKIRPCTLEVGDYILTPQICIERKSIPDLVGSFKSGRLYTQAEAMCLHYQIPVLLIEFTQGKSFSLGMAGGDKEGEDLNSKLALLAITFPKLRIIWSSSPAATAEIFEDLKKDQKEPSMEDAMGLGIESGEPIDSVFSITPSDMIRSLPGITSRNYRNIMRRVESISAIAKLSLEECQVLVGDEGGRALYEFLVADARKRPTV
ncbi:UNVERIFIED_CONTAM: hypothetical protein HDU68_001225 [Siphonaria sp. JEL0065]|nr:hypothetical protein HDU68_001225 [Siphonaria sp. JEL0065]